MKFFGSLYVNCLSLSHQRKADSQKIKVAKLRCALCVLILCAVSLQGPTHAQLMTPEEALGFQVGSDYQVAGWQTVSDYMRHVAANSDRILVDELGKTTEGNDLLMLLISAPENLENLARYQEIQRALATPARK